MKKLFSGHNQPPFIDNRYLRKITVLITVFSILAVVLVMLNNVIAGVILLLLACLGIGGSLIMMNQMSLGIHRYISDLFYRIHRGEQESLLEMPIGIIILDRTDRIAWLNPYLKTYFKAKRVLGRSLNETAPGLKSLVGQYWDSNRTHVVTWNHHHFVLLIQRAYRTIYLLDVTHSYRIKKQAAAERISIGEIFLDNYAEITQAMSDQTVSNLHNYVTNELSKWAQRFGIYLKQVDDDHFIILAYAKALKAAEANKFAILDRIRETTSKQNFPLTLSVGIAYADSDLNRLANQAQQNLDLALGRGGDQVVVKAQGSKARFYGGKTNPMEKRTRVRARMTSQALQELMKESDQVFVQGHMHPDMDALGACLGIHRIARMNHRKCWIVLKKEKRHSDVTQLLHEIKKDSTIADALVSPNEALKKATDRSLLIMVDHSKPTISVSYRLYQRLQNRVMIIDHHRQGEEFPANPLLVYIEPYASSACELITEIIEYQSQNAEPINKLEATAMLSGIVTDTQSFSIRTGTRTFDAASYLRSAGADAGQIHRFMQENLTDYLARDHLISRVQIDSKHRVALVIGESDRKYDPVTAAQVADSLLTISGIEASFVATERPDGQIGISARSNGQVNVQLIMEQLGGGGHLSSGATQIKNKPMKAIHPMLKSAIRQVIRKELPSDRPESSKSA